MIIKKESNIYSVAEAKDKWVVKLEGGKVSIAYEIPKGICYTIDELKMYIQEDDLF